ncbi:MAG TPA: hypothetical protein VGL71_11390, partial [Urbifossiella sp.]
MEAPPKADAPLIIDSPPDQSSERPPEPPHPETTEFRLPAPRIDETERLWRLAVEGQTEAAYSGLRVQFEMNPDRSDLLLRLYWLLALQPALDAERTRHNWLAAALVRSRFSGSAVELYRRELGHDADAALNGTYLELLSAEGRPHDLLAVARMRLAAAGRTRLWIPIEKDCRALSRSLPFQDETAWLGYLVSSVDWTAWDRPAP